MSSSSAELEPVSSFNLSGDVRAMGGIQREHIGVAAGMYDGGVGGLMIRLSGLGIPALRISVADVLRISFALVQSSPVVCERLTR